MMWSQASQLTGSETFSVLEIKKKKKIQQGIFVIKWEWAK